MRIIGLTGGIASGKSTVARMLTDRGMTVIDADQLAREVVLPGSPGLQAVVAEFGPEVLQGDGTLDRAALAERIFADPAARRRLEAILHPAIKSLAESRLGQLKASGEPVVFYMAPLLIEAGATDRVDEIWVVFVEREVQLARIQQRDGVSRADALKRVAAQMPMEEKAARGRVVIDNSGSLRELEERVAAVLESEGLGSR